MGHIKRGQMQLTNYCQNDEWIAKFFMPLNRAQKSPAYFDIPFHSNIWHQSLPLVCIWKQIVEKYKLCYNLGISEFYLWMLIKW